MHSKVEIGANIGELLDQVATVEVSDQHVTTTQEPQVLSDTVEQPLACSDAVSVQASTEAVIAAVTPVQTVAATPEPEHPKLFVKQAKTPITPRKLDLRIVGLCVEPEAAGLITADAERVCRGYIMYGPSITYAGGMLPYESFLSKLKMDKLVLRQRFRYDRENGKLYRGALMHDIEGKHTCGSCKRIYFNLTFGKLNELRREQGVQQGAPYCQLCLNSMGVSDDSTLKERARLRWRAEDAQSVGAGDIRARQLYSEYSKCVGRQNSETMSILPRVWAVYPITATPGDWVPEDTVASEIDAAEHKQGLTIRPLAMVDRSNAGALLALRMEATRGADGKPGMAVGLLDTASLISTQECGYTMQLVPRYRFAVNTFQKHGYRGRYFGNKVGQA